ncbi:MAG TPA: NUDIX domain-containing protein [Candidatus Limnocylindrales bacterium]|jgi:ADP-ribose pyrophosphatase YjhB (NUDIX family)|nr:NUDIX domain-containing protein [Candidatus Limnocylindrales bacterium]
MTGEPDTTAKSDRAGSRRVRVGAYALAIDAAGRVLLCRVAPSITPGQVWTLPGGGLDFGEAPEIGVLRELAEESGYEGEIEALLDASSRIFTDSHGATVHAVRIVYRVRVTGGELRDEVDGSTDTCGWFTADEAVALDTVELVRRVLPMATAGA